MADIVLEQAIIFDPLVASPDISIAEAIARMSAARADCLLSKEAGGEQNFLQKDARASCLLVLQGTHLVGVLTERDVVRLSAEGHSFADCRLSEVMTVGVITLRQSEFTDIFTALHLLQHHHIRHLPVVDEQGQVVGVLTHETLRQLLRPVDMLRLQLVAETMTTGVIHATPDASILHIAQLMAEHRVSSVVIAEPQTLPSPTPPPSQSAPVLVPIGIITEGDIVQFQALSLPFQQIQAQQVMSTPVFAVRPQDSLWTAQQWMQEKRLSRLIVEGERRELLGIVTQSTLLQALNPIEIYRLVKVLENKVCNLEAEKMELLQNRNTVLEGQVQQRTAELKKQTEREQLLSTIAARIRASLELPSTLDAIVTEVRQFLQCDRVLVYRFNPDWSGMVTAEAVLPEWIPACNNIITDSCFQSKADQLYAQGLKHAVSNIYEAGYPACYIQLLEQYQVKANLVMPILVEEQLWGLLIGQQCGATRVWETTELELLERITVQVAIAIQQSQAYEKSQREIAERRQAEAALRRSEATRQAIIRGIPDLLIRTNLRGERLEFLSGGEVHVLSPDPEKPHPTVFDVLPEPLAKKQLQAIQQTITSGHRQSYEQLIEVNQQIRWEEVRVAPLANDEAIVIIRDITDRKQAEAAFQSLVEGVAAIGGENFFARLVQYIAEVLNVRYVMVATQQGSSLESAAFWLDGQIQPNIAYCIDDTPCNLAVNLGEYICLSGVQQQFPTNQALKALEAEAYIGLALNDMQGEIIGCLYIVDSKPITQPELAISMLRVFAARVSSELERQTAIDALKHLNEELEDRINQRTAELRQSEERFRQIFEQSPVGIAISDLTGKFTRINSSLLQILGYSKAELLERSIQDLLSAQSQQQGEEWLHQLMEQTLPLITFEAQLISGRGETIWMNVTSALIFNGFGRPSSVIHLLENVDERKRAEAERKQAEAELHRTLKELSDFKYALDEATIVAITDARDRITYVNDRFCQISKYSREEVIGQSHRMLNSGYHPQEFFAVLWQTISQAKIWRGEIQNRAKDGTYYWVDMTIVPFLDPQGQPLQYLAICTDITDRKAAEFRAESLKKRLQFLLSSSPAVIYTCNPTGDYGATSISENVTALLGYEPDEFLQDSKFWLNHLHPSDRSRVLAEMSALFDQGHYCHEYRFLHRDGTYRWMRDELRLIYDATGAPREMVGYFADITDLKQAELELQELSQSLQNAMEGISRLDGQGRYLTLNQAYAKPCGYEPEELIGLSWQITVHPEDIPLLEAAYQTMLLQGRVEAEARGIRKDGSLFYKQVTMVTALDKDGQFNGHYCFLKDISDRKVIEEALKRQLAAIEAAIDGIAVLENGTYTYLNKAHVAMFGYKYPEELLGKSWTALYAPAEIERLQQEVFPVLGQQHFWQGEAIATRQDGSTFNEGLSLTLTEGGVLICVCRDITEQKQAETKIRQTNEQLLLANAELARATRLKDEFLANMSHELRTPLNAILGMAEGLQEQVFGNITNAQQQAITTIDRSGRHLLDLINDILDLSKIESGKLELQRSSVSIKYLCETSLTFVRQLAIKKNIQLTSEIPATLPDICVDELRIRQVLINLLNNAVKFTPEGGSVQLLVSQEVRETTSLIQFQVRDSGIGIAPEDLSKLFQPFVQIDSSLTRQHAGTGLGLSLVQQLTQLHGGTVAVTSQVGQGSCFTVQIPYLAASNHQTSFVSPHQEPLPPCSSRTVLVIEDVPSAAEQTTRYLTEVGLHTVVCTTGQAALIAARETQPALIILDILLPDVSGWEVLTQLKSQPQTQRIPVVIASVMDERSRGISLGASGYLVKPINRSQLQSVLSNQQIPFTPPVPTPTSVSQVTPDPPSILLAEDNAANVATFSAYLKNRGFQLILAQDGAEAIAMAETHQPDLILMDIQMPKVDGLTAIRQIRINPAIAHIPIIALTALVMPTDREKCIEAGANSYMTKPVKLKLLAEEIQRLLSEP